MGRLIGFEMATLLRVAVAVVELVALGGHDGTRLGAARLGAGRAVRWPATAGDQALDHLVRWRGQFRRRLVRAPRLAEQCAAFKIRNDPRLTRVRRLLRPH